MKKLFFLLIITPLMGFSQHSLFEENVIYKDNGTTLEGFMVYDKAISGPRPAVIVTHEWTGINENVKEKCRKLAALGYVAFAADVYGKGVRPEGPEAAGKESSKYKNDRPLLRRRMNAAYMHVITIPQANPQKIAVTGYCFGGTAAIELARSGAPIKGVVSFHGGLSHPDPSTAENIQCDILICHGAEDPSVPDEEVKEFTSSLDEAGVDYTFIAYSDAVHSFTNPSAGDDPSKGNAYNKRADEQSWEHMKLFLEEVYNKD